MRSRASAPPTPPKPSANGSRSPTPRPGLSAPSPHPATTTPGRGRAKGKGRARDSKGHSGKRARRGPKLGQAPIETGHRKRHNMGAANHPRTRKGQERGPRHRGKGHHGRRHDPHPGRAYQDGGISAAPPPPNAARLPGAHLPARTAEASIGRRTDHTTAHPPASRNHTGVEGHTYTGRTGYTHRGSRKEGCRAAYHHDLTARRQPRPPQGPPHRHWKRTKGRPQQPGLGTGTPRGQGTKAQAHREGNPFEVCPTHQPERHAQAPTARTQRDTHT